MGVEWFPCSRCKDSICDAGRWESCGDNCDRRWCTKQCAEADGRRRGEDDEYDIITCNPCRDEDLDDYYLVPFLLEQLKLTRKEAVKLFNDKLKEEKDASEQGTS